MRWRRGRHHGTGALGAMPPVAPQPPADGRATWQAGRAGDGGGMVIRFACCTTPAAQEDVASILGVAGAGKASIVVADMTAVIDWDDAALSSLLDAQRDLAAKGVSLRLVVWSQDLYKSLQSLSQGSDMAVHANVDAALRRA